MTLGVLAAILILEAGLIYAARRRAIARGNTPKTWHYVAPLGVLAVAILVGTLVIQHN